ncbi:MAG: TRAFs-binding domain-containing protein [Candidatus Accumulibacter meliphilus]|uniref:TRAFs-binding domain-containing protein n=1 Tax=Candidatus Accumulibacter meliphilus TaxID=2211374 RepID=UPI002FC3DCA0
MMLPLCFVLMPFGKKAIPSGTTVDFDAVFHELIAPAIEAAGMEALRADQEVSGGVIHKPMYERLILCDFAVADLTGANANVFYELGLRHGVRPATTVLLYAGSERMSFDVAPLRALPYQLGADGKPTDVEGARQALSKLLETARAARGEASTDSPVFQLLEGYTAPDIARLKTDVFRDCAHYAVEARKQLADARRAGKDALKKAAGELGEVQDLEAGVVIDLFLSYRALSDWQAMVDLVAQMSAPLARSVLVREQLGFALNRLKRRDEAEELLVELIKEHGASSETNGLLGRVYKDRWDEARNANELLKAKGSLSKAIDTYLKGFEADWRDAYPGINAVTLMELKNPPDPRRLELLPVVSYAVKRRLANGTPDYWDHATLLELAVLQKDEDAAMEAAGNALAAVRESWEPETTARNLALIRAARAARGDEVAWAAVIEDELDKRAAG